MAISTIFARKERTTDKADIRIGFGKRMDTVVYADRESTKKVGLWCWHYSNCPDRRFRTVMLNCTTYKIEWLPAMKVVEL